MVLRTSLGTLLVRASIVSLLATSAAVAAPRSVPIADLVKRINIPFSQFTLPNGLRVVVHTDHKAPVVAIQIWYHVGSKDEVTGKTGFAHLFEHLMFNGSEHAPGSVIEQMDQLGASDLNGTTNNDRTNFFETVPTGALDRALFIESDRMGYLLQGLSQPKLDIQRGVVQNEKRQGDNQPYGLVQYHRLEALYPEGNPYRHPVIGSMDDLDHASMDDVRAWFRNNYGPNNAVLVLAGDIDLATAKEKVTHWFGGLPRGPEVQHPVVSVPTLATPRQLDLHDQISLSTVVKFWAVPGVTDKDSVLLDLAAAVLGGLDSSRFNDILVRKQQVTVGAGAANASFEKGGYVETSVTAKPGITLAAATQAMNRVIAQFLETGPTLAELNRAKISMISGQIAGLERVGGKAGLLAEGLTYANDPAHYHVELERIAAATPAQVRDAARRWLNRPALTLTLTPGPREAYVETKRHDDIAKTATPALPPSIVTDDRKAPPPLQPLTALTFPKIERTTLRNGIHVTFARRSDVPVVLLNMIFDAGTAADTAGKLGEQNFLISALSEGTSTRSAAQIAADSETIGARVTQSLGADRSTIGLYALSPNLDASLDLLADVVLRPKLAPNDVERVRAQLLAGLAENQRDPNYIGGRAMAAALYGPDHPYGRPGQGTATSVKSVSVADLRSAYGTWFRPDMAQIIVVGDTDLAALKPLLEARFGGWRVPSTPKPTKSYDLPTPAPQQRITIVDRPNSPQSLIYGGELLNATGRDDLLALRTSNEVLGSGFGSRIYHDLREVKSWAYGTGATIGQEEHQINLTINAPVQADKTGASISAILDDTKAFLTTKGTTSDEFSHVIDGNIRRLPGAFETAGAVLTALQKIEVYQRPDDYYTRLPARYRELTPAMIDAAARAKLDANKLMFVVVGDVAKVKPQLDALGLPVDVAK